MNNILNISGSSESSDKFKLFFIEQLNLNYCSKSHLVERLAEIIDHKNLFGYQRLINATILAVTARAEKIQELYQLLHASYSFNNCNELIQLIENDFSKIQLETNDLQYTFTAFISYLSTIESIDANSFDMMRVLSARLESDKIRQVLTLANLSYKSTFACLER